MLFVATTARPQITHSSLSFSDVYIVNSCKRKEKHFLQDTFRGMLYKIQKRFLQHFTALQVKSFFNIAYSQFSFSGQIVWLHETQKNESMFKSSSKEKRNIAIIEEGSFKEFHYLISSCLSLPFVSLSISTAAVVLSTAV